MAGFANDVVFANNGDFSIAGSNKGSAANGLNTDGQMWIGSTATNAGGTHINVGGITSPGGTINVGYSSPNITLDTLASSDLHAARYIVSAGGSSDGANFTTISSAYAAAVSAGGRQTVFIQPGIYTEDITLSPNVNISAFSCDALNPNVAIVGNLTANYTGVVSISGICIQTNSAPFLTCSGTNVGSLYLVDCLLRSTNNNGMALSNLNFSVFVINTFTLTSAGQSLFVITATAGLEFDNCRINATDATASTISGNFVNFKNSTVGSVISCSSTGIIYSDNCIMNPPTNVTSLVTSGTGTAFVNNSSFFTGTATCITVGSGSTVNLINCSLNSQNTNAVTGSGILAYSNIGFYGGSTQFDPSLTLSLQGSTPANAPTGYVLTSTGTNTSPTWQAPGGLSQVAFYAYMSAASQSIAAATPTTVECDTVVFDKSSNYDNSTYTFTAPNTGIYFFGGSIYNSTNLTVYLVQLVASSFTVQNNMNYPSDQQSSCTVSGLIAMTAGDTCTLKASSNNGMLLSNSSFQGGTYATFFYGYQVA